MGRLVPVGEIPGERGRDAEDRDESGDLVDQRNADLKHTDRRIQKRRDQPGSDEQRGPARRRATEHAVTEPERRKTGETADDHDDDMHVASLIPPTLAMGATRSTAFLVACAGPRPYDR